jgi:PAS domain S-box-containing protein
MGVVSGLDAFPDRPSLCRDAGLFRCEPAPTERDGMSDGAISAELAACARALLAADSASADAIAAVVLESARRLTRSPTALVGRYDPIGQTLIPPAIAGSGWPESALAVVHRIRDERRPLTLESPSTTASPFDRLLVVPALESETPNPESVAGVVGVAGARQNYDHHDVAALRRLGELYALALRRLTREAERAWLARAVEQAPVSIVLSDCTGTLRYVNPAFSHTTGYSRDEALGQSARVLKSGYTPPSEYERLWAALAAGQVWRGEFHNKRKNDELFWEAAAIGPIRDDQGRVIGYVAVKDDISKRKATEIDLLTAKEAAEDASQAKSTFLAHVSHELRTPLNAIIGFAEIMDRQLFGPVGDSHYRDYARYIGDSGRHLLALINDILDLSKVEAGRMDMIEEAVDMVAAIETACTLLRTRAEVGRVLLTTSWGGIAPRLRADARMVQQILLNIISNAVKFTPPEGRVTVTSQSDSHGGLVIKIADTGPGMTETDLSIALAPFGQLRTLAAPTEGGSGLGLPLAKSLTELHGGSLTLASQPQVGTTVTIRFPPERVVPETSHAIGP